MEFVPFLASGPTVRRRAALVWAGRALVIVAIVIVFGMVGGRRASAETVTTQPPSLTDVVGPIVDTVEAVTAQVPVVSDLPAPVQSVTDMLDDAVAPVAAAVDEVVAPVLGVVPSVPLPTLPVAVPTLPSAPIDGSLVPNPRPAMSVDAPVVSAPADSSTMTLVTSSPLPADGSSSTTADAGMRVPAGAGTSPAPSPMAPSSTPTGITGVADCGAAGARGGADPTPASAVLPSGGPRSLPSFGIPATDVRSGVPFAADRPPVAPD